MNILRCKVSIHAPAGGATGNAFLIEAYTGVSIHAPAGGATPSVCFRRLHGRCFNPRSRRGSDTNDDHEEWVLEWVSIHAPAGGATSVPFERPVFGAVSIHAPAGGATAHTGMAEDLEKVSIHAPAGGATHLEKSSWAELKEFQSTLPQGERRPGHSQDGRFYLFQSTLPQGERPKRMISVMCIIRFNPRSRRGSDTVEPLHSPVFYLFQSTLPQGERLINRGFKINYIQFQSTLPQGERQI